MHPDDHDLYSSKRLIYSVVITLILLLPPVALAIWTHFGDDHLLRYGMRPWDLTGLLGILTMPFLHGGPDHLISNIIPFFVLGSGLFYFYRETAWKVLCWITILTGIWLWFIGKPGSNHIGASGVVYGLVAFHLTSGAIRKNRNLLAFALLVVFLYGGFIWSVFPDFFPDRNISWEGHLAGLTAGIAIAWLFRRKGPKPDPVMPDDEESDDELSDEPENDPDLQNASDQDDHVENRGTAGNQSTTLDAGHPYRYHAT
jgi:membrane associated rhomboid family serine protease